MVEQDRFLTLAVCQADAGLNGSQERLDWLASQVRAAQAEGADLVIFPELFVTGYNIGDNLHRFAEAVDGAFAERAKALAIECKMAIIFGYPERTCEGVYNSAVFICEDGKIYANHRKTALPDGIEPDWFETGDDLTIVHFRGARIAMTICYECEFPETVRYLAMAGADVVTVCTACGWDQVPNLVVPSRAFENGVFMAYANFCGVENGHSFAGLSCIVDPYGNDLARASKDASLIVAKLDLSLSAEAQTRLPYLRDHQKVPTQERPTEVVIS